MTRQLTPLARVCGLAVGVAAAAALGGGVAAGAGNVASRTVSTSHTVSPSQAGAQVAGCATAQLTVWYGGPSGAAAGSSYIPLEFSNIGGASCALYGFPGVSGIVANGTQLGSPARWNHVIAPRTVVLAPGATAHVVLQIVNVGNYPSTVCGPTQAYGLRVYPPNQRASVEVSLPFEACSKSGPTYLSVDPVNAGVGIPRYTSN